MHVAAKRRTAGVAMTARGQDIVNRGAMIGSGLIILLNEVLRRVKYDVVARQRHDALSCGPNSNLLRLFQNVRTFT